MHLLAPVTKQSSLFTRFVSVVEVFGPFPFRAFCLPLQHQIATDGTDIKSLMPGKSSSGAQSPAITNKSCACRYNRRVMRVLYSRWSIGIISVCTDMVSCPRVVD